jgi:hypothetical protein
MPDILQLNLSLVYTPPAAPANSGQAALASTHTYNSFNVGSIDVPNGTVIGTTFDIPLGSVEDLKTLMIRNNMTSEIGVRLNAAVANNFNIPAGGTFVYSVPTAPLAVPITEAVLVTTADPTNLERILFWAFGD